MRPEANIHFDVVVRELCIDSRYFFREHGSLHQESIKSYYQGQREMRYISMIDFELFKLILHFFDANLGCSHFLLKLPLNDIIELLAEGAHVSLLPFDYIRV